MEVPVERHPEHHGNLPTGARRGLEVVARGVRDRGYEELVVLQSRFSERVDMAPPVSWIVARFRCLRLGLQGMIIIVVFGLYYNGPSSGEDAAVNAELVGLEEEAAKDWNDGKVLPIGKADDGRCGSHVSWWRAQRANNENEKVDSSIYRRGVVSSCSLEAPVPGGDLRSQCGVAQEST